MSEPARQTPEIEIRPLKKGRLARYIVSFLVIILQLFWVYWFLVTPLPNATPATSETKITRGLLLLTTTPGLNPEFQWSQSLLGKAVEQISHVTGLVDRIPVIGLASIMIAGIWGLGSLLWRCFLGNHEADYSDDESLLVKLALGTAAWGSLTLVLGRLGMLQQSFWLIIVIALTGSGLYLGRNRSFLQRLRSLKALVSLIPWPALPFVLIMILASMLPTIDFDCIEYHLQGPKEYWQAGRIGYLPHNIYTNMPFGVEMLHTSAMSLAGDWQLGALTGQFLIAVHGLMVACLIQLVCRRLGNSQAGWWGALIYLSTPWTYRLSAIPYVEGPLCAATIGWVWSVTQAWGQKLTSKWVVVGVFAGWAMSCKYTAILPVVVPSVFVTIAAVWCQRTARPLFGVIIGGTLIFGPWLVKNLVDTGNPVYPLAWNLFGGIDWDPGMNAKWAAAHGRKPLQWGLLWSSFVEVAGRSDWQTPLLLAFAPLSILIQKPIRQRIILVWALALWIFISWWLFTHRLDRFWLPIQPVFAILAGVGLVGFKNTRASTVWCHVFIAFSLSMNWIYCSTALAGLNEWTVPLSKLWQSVPNRLYPASVLVDQSLQAQDKVLLVGQAAVFYWQHPIIYNTVFNRENIEIIARGRSSAEVHQTLKELGVTVVFVDWAEISRYRQPGNYGFTDFVTQELFSRLEQDGVLQQPAFVGPQKTLYYVNK